MKQPPIRTLPRERGAVLVVSLIMLAVMTLFVISMLKTSIIELKIGGASQVAALNFGNAESALNKTVDDNNGRFAPGFATLTMLGTGCNRVTVGAGPCVDPPSFDGGTVAVTLVQLACGPWAQLGVQMGATNLQAVQFDVRAAATSTLGGSTVLHQGVQTLAPPNSCI